MIFSLFLVLFGVLLTGISQILLKTGLSRQGMWENSIFSAYLNLPTIIAYLLFLVVTIINVMACKEVPLKVLYAITSLNLVVVLGLSICLLKERVSQVMTVGIVLIIGGIFVFNL